MSTVWHEYRALGTEPGYFFSPELSDGLCIMPPSIRIEPWPIPIIEQSRVVIMP